MRKLTETIQQVLRPSSRCSFLAIAIISLSVFSTNSANATIVLSGTNSENYTGGDPWGPSFLTVGSFAPGSLSISNGSVVYTGGSFFEVAQSSSASTSSVSIDGAASALNSTYQSVTVGSSGTATIQVTNGAKLNNSSATVVLGDGASGNGSVTVDGAGSTWSATYLTIGNSGTGTVQITNGGTLNNGSPVSQQVTIGQSSGSSGTMTIGGGRGTSSWTNSASLTVGQFGAGTLNIVGGGKVTTGTTTIGTHGSVTVGGGTGTATWTNSQRLMIGNITGGTLNIDTGGLVIAPQILTSDGAINFDGGTLRLLTPSSGDNFQNPVTLQSGGGTLDLNASFSSLVIGSSTSPQVAISGVGGLTKVGLGNLILAGFNTYSGGTTVSAGSLTVSTPYALGTGGLTITNSSSAQFLNPLGTVVLPSLNIDNGSATPTSKFDIGRNAVVIPYSGTSPLSTIKSQIYYATHGPFSTPTGIYSSSANGFSTAIGYAEASELFLDNGGTFVNNEIHSHPISTPISGEAVILKYTWIGDTDLDGVVSQSDFNNLFSNLGTQSSANWSMGDTDGNGTVDQTDVNNFLANLGAVGLSNGEATQPVPVPEPDALLLTVLGLAGLSAVRWRQAR